MVLLSLVLGPAATLNSARSLVLNCFVASTICFVIYYVTSVNINAITNGSSLLRGGDAPGGERGYAIGLDMEGPPFAPYLENETSTQQEQPLDDDDEVAPGATPYSVDLKLNFTYNERSEVVRSEWL